jgi:hypothetical protein
MVEREAGSVIAAHKKKCPISRHLAGKAFSAKITPAPQEK